MASQRDGKFRWSILREGQASCLSRLMSHGRKPVHHLPKAILLIDQIAFVHTLFDAARSRCFDSKKRGRVINRALIYNTENGVLSTAKTGTTCFSELWTAPRRIAPRREVSTSGQHRMTTSPARAYDALAVRRVLRHRAQHLRCHALEG